MSNYTKTTNFAAKDSLPSGNAAKIVKGTEIDTEFNNIATASATKANSNNAALTGTTVFETLSDGTLSITGWVDEDNMSSDSASLVPTQQSVKAYVDSQVTAQDLDVTDGSASIDIDLDSESLGILGGTGITSSASGTGVTLAIDSTVTTLTGTQTLTNKTLTSPTLTTPTITTSFTIGSATITEAELEILDGATVTTAELNVLDGITSTTAELNILDGVTSTAAELNILDGVTSTAAEINILDGVTSTTAELNILDGVTSTAAELNILDGVTSTATELNILDGVTATTAEINYVDGVTSNVQTQLNTKAPIAGATFTGTTTIPTADINGGAIDGTVIGGSTAAAGSFTTLGASGAITGTLGTAAQTNITSVGTLSALTVSGDLTVDTNSLKVDSSNNRVGILNASPDVTLDIGTATDAVHMPTGTTAQRPTGAAGYFRYNSTLEQFEGYTDAWGAIGGGGGSNLVSDTMTGDGSDTTLTLSNDPLNENNTQVYIDGVYQNKDTYSVSGTTLTFSTAPPNGSAVEAMTIQPTAVNVPADASVTSAKLSGDLTTPGALTVSGVLKLNQSRSTYVDATEDASARSHMFVTNDGVGDFSQEAGHLVIQARTHTSVYRDIIFAGGVGSASDLMRITGEGSVGIGTSSPDEQLHLHGGASATRLRISGGALGETYGGFIEAEGVSGQGGHLRLGVVDNGTDRVAIEIEEQGNQIVFDTAGSEAMRIDASGNLLVGVTTLADVNGLVTNHLFEGANSTAGDGAVGVYNNTGTANAPALVVLNRDASTDTSNRFVQFYANVTSSGSTAMGGIVGNGASNVQFSAISDVREKTNIESITGSLDKITSLNPVEFDWIASGEHCKAGFVAQEVEAVFPEFVVENMASEGQEERKGLTGGMTGGIVAHLVKAIQEQQETITALTARIEQLENN